MLSPIATPGLHPRRIFALATVAALVLCACAAQPTVEPTTSAPDSAFSHTPVSDNTPWSHERFDDEPGKFTFAIFSDLTGGEREGVYAVATEQLRLLRPELVIGVGDLIEGGVEERARLHDEWDSFDARSSRSIAPLFYVPGNHDLTNPVQWDVWEARYGPRYYHFVYKDVLFLVLDTEDNPTERQQAIHDARVRAMARVAEEGWGIWSETGYSGMQESHTGTIGEAQSAYFRDVIASHPDVRWTFVFMHKPAWLKEDEQNFLAIEEALSGRDYTVFNGHNHDYVYRTRNGRDYIQLATTGGVQLAGKQKAVDHVTLVTVSGSGVDIANLELAGIFDKTGRIPLNGEDLCFEACGGSD